MFKKVDYEKFFIDHGISGKASARRVQFASVQDDFDTSTAAGNEFEFVHSTSSIAKS